MRKKKKEFSVLKWIIFPLNSVVLAGIIAYFNVTVFGYRDGLPYTAIVALIGVFSILINRYTESENRNLAKAAFIFEIVLTAALIINACYSVSVQRKMSVARMAESSQKDTIGEISKLRGSRTQREALQKVDKQTSAQSVFAGVENILFWIMVGELGLYGLSAFTLFAIAKLVDDEEIEEEFPASLEVKNRLPARRENFTANSDSARQWRISARKKLLEHLKIVSHYHPGKWFKADLVEGGVLIRMAERRHGIEETIAETRQSDKLLMAVDRPDFREKLIEELRHQGFEI